MITYEEALSSAQAGKVVFIVGAGFSTGATNRLGKKLPTGNELKNTLSKELDFDSDYNLEVISQQYLDQFGENQLIKILKDTFLIDSVSEFYKLLSCLKKAHYYTTNFDNLIEEIYKNTNKEIKSFTLKDNIKKAAKGLFVLHINGKIEQDTETLEGIRLTLDSYDKSFFSSPWIKYFCDDLRGADAIFILGYSILADLDLRRIISAYKDKIFIIQYPELSVKDKKVLEKYGRVIENGIGNFIKDLSKTPIPPKPDTIEKMKLKCFHSKTGSYIIEKANDQQLFDFFIKGDLFEKEIFYQNENQKFTFLINREQLLKAKNFLDEGSSIIIHSNLGNGKSVFLEQLIRISNDYNFYIYDNNVGQDFYKELKTLHNLAQKTVVVFDPYNAHYEVIKYINHLGETNLRFLFIARTAMNELFEDRLEKGLSYLVFRHIDLNVLSNKECLELNEILFNNGLWGKDSASSQDLRLRILSQKCKANLQNIILYLFENSEIKHKFINIISKSKSNQARKILIILFINTVLELQLRNDDLNALYKVDIYKLMKNSGFSELIQYNSADGWVAKSPIISKAMLNSPAFNKNEIMETLKDLTIKLDKLYDGCQVYINALKQLGSCSYLSFIFNYDIDKKEILDYFETVKNIDFNKNNYFFWMQYAIACVNTHEYERADQYFKTAYSFARKKSRGFSTFQIDNHFARFLLDRQIYYRNPTNAYNNFVNAHNLLIRAHRDMELNDRYYQFRVARCYKDYFEIFYQQFNDEEKNDFINKCREIDKNLTVYEKESNRSNTDLRNDVLECKNNIKYILTKI